jgi:hypothetical protein
VDLDGDDNPDLLSGSYSLKRSINAGLFQVLQGRPGGRFDPAKVLTGEDGKPLVIGNAGREAICTRPFAVDWNGDGHLDLVVGNSPGNFHLFKGRGGGRFAQKSERMGRLAVPGQSDPFCVDWDRDGDLDILSGAREGGVYYAENVAGKGASPRLKPFRVLIPARGNSMWNENIFWDDGDLRGPGAYTRIWVDDVNRDGKPDILVGDMISQAIPKKSSSGLTLSGCKAKVQALNSEKAKLLIQLRRNRNESEVKKLKQRFSECMSTLTKFVQYKKTGFVWLYLGK